MKTIYEVWEIQKDRRIDSHDKGDTLYGTHRSLKSALIEAQEVYDELNQEHTWATYFRVSVLEKKISVKKVKFVPKKS